jgi:hypothetical protein
MEFHEFELPIALQTLHFRQEDQLLIKALLNSKLEN